MPSMRTDGARPDKAAAVAELTDAFHSAWDDPAVGVVALTGAGERAFCVGHDQKEEEAPLRMREVDALHRAVREIPKPVIAAVNGLAVGGGHVLHVLCDLTIAADTARFHFIEAIQIARNIALAVGIAPPASDAID